MKILKAGVEMERDWWVSKRIHCYQCGQEALLETGDDKQTCFVHVNPMAVQITCTNCGEIIGLRRLVTLAA